ncbi:MAG: 3-phosphoshikimate 1-carboxyvinyltransferase [Pseudomonadota bacterium]
MAETPWRNIRPLTRRPSPVSVSVPGSKSCTHRMLIAAALSNGACRVFNPLDSDDTQLTRQALGQMGAVITGTDPLHITGTGGTWTAAREAIYLGNSGTSMRLLAGLTALGDGVYRLTGSPRMCERPIQDLLDGLAQIGVPARSVAGTGCPPVDITGGVTFGGRTRLRCRDSSQYLSAMMLMAPCTRDGLDITVTEGPVSKPYIDLTIDIMRQFGITLSHEHYTAFHIPGAQQYQCGTYYVEPDSSQAGYFWAAGAITGASITVSGIHRTSRQGDTGFCDILSQMGCTVSDGAAGITVTGGRLTGISVDMGAMPDMVPTLAVVAAYAEGITDIGNVRHLRIKESDRLEAVACELRRMGVRVETRDDGLRIHGGGPQAADIQTYDDHRMAMSFAVAGLRTPGVRIGDPSCVNKSFPNFWKVFDRLYGEAA